MNEILQANSKRIIFVHPPGLNKPGGAERVLVTIANGLAERGIKVAIVVYKDIKPYYYRLNPDVEIYRLDNSSTLGFIKRIRQIRQLYIYIKIFRPNALVHLGSRTIILTILSSLLHNNVYTAAWLHYSYHKRMDVFEYLFRNTYGRLLKAIVILNKTDVLGYGHHFRNILHIPNPTPFHTENLSSQNNKTIIAVGRISRIKGFSFLLRAFAKIVHEENIEGWRLKIFGDDGGDKQTLIHLSHQLGIDNHLSFNDSVVDIENEYIHSDIYAMTSITECFPMVLLEAHECGLPIVSFDCNSGPRDIITNRVDGLLIRPYDVDLFAAALHKLIADESLRKKMGKIGSSNIKRFNLDIVMKSWEKDIINHE
jgi:glycosyltransferase involved in cell wall biosynthesis